MKDKAKIVTILDIAKKAKVSIGTVDRVVHNRGRVAKETSLKVKRIIEKMGYKPNIFASRLSRSKTFHFGVLIPNLKQDTKYWEASMQGIIKAEKELAAYHVKIKYLFFDRYSPAGFTEVSKKILNEGIDGLLIAPVHYKVTKEFISTLPKHIPYVFFNTTIPELSPLSFIGQDSFQSGLVCGKLMKMLIHEPGSIALFLTAQNDFHIHNRAKGFQEIFKDNLDIKVTVYELYNYRDKKNTIRILDKIFIENPDLRGIYITNVYTFHFAEYLKHNVTGKKIHLIGYDLIKKNIQYLNEEIIDFLINQKPEQQGYEGIYALYRHVVMHESCNPNIVMPIDIITRENVNYYIDSCKNI